MDLFKKTGTAKDLVRAIAKMRPVTYTQPPTELQRIHKRLMNGRGEFQKVMSTIFAASVGVSMLDLRVLHTSEGMKKIGSELKDSAGNLHDVAGGTSAIAEQVSGMQESLKNTVEDITAASRAVFDRIEENQTQMTDIKAISEEAAQHAGEAGHAMEELMEVIGHIAEKVSAVSAISAQINLFALNSSIEATRSGETGRGYAMVAEQIRQLSEETRELTDAMDELVGSVHGISEKGIRSAAAAASSLASVDEKISGMREACQAGKDSLAQINYGLDSITDSMKMAGEEICDSLKGVEQRIQTIDTECQKIHEEAEQIYEAGRELEETTRPFESLEKLLDYATRRLGKMAEDTFYMPDNQLFMDFINSAITEHEKWLETLNDIVTSQKIMPLQIDDTKCGFGCFYYSVTPKNSELRQVWDVIGDKHRSLHDAAVSVLQAVEQQDAETAKKECARAKEIYEELMQDLQKMLTIAEQLEKMQMRIFEQS